MKKTDFGPSAKKYTPAEEKAAVQKIVRQKDLFSRTPLPAAPETLLNIPQELVGQFPNAAQEVKLQHSAISQVRAIHEHLHTTGINVDRHQLQTIARLHKDLRDFIPLRAKDSHGVYQIHNTQRLNRYIEQLGEGRIVTTDYVQRTLDKVVSELATGAVVTLYGDTGAGKTEVAKIAAQQFSGKPPVLVRCAKDMAPKEIYGGSVLKTTSEMSPTVLHNEIDTAVALLEEKLAGQSADVLAMAKTKLVGDIITRSGSTYSEYVLGAAYIAAKEGRVLILDEADMADNNIKMKLNDLLIRRPGESIRVQENGGSEITVAQGFGVIKTQNSSSASDPRYKNGRVLDDAAQENRSASIHYNYLPQATAGELSKCPPEQRELFLIVICTLLKGHDLKELTALALPIGSSLDQLWNLACFAALTQKFHRNEISGSDPHAPQRGGVPISFECKNPLTPRTLVRLLERWGSSDPRILDGAYTKSLDHHLFATLRASTRDDEQYAILKQVAERFGFSTDRLDPYGFEEPIRHLTLLSALFGTPPTPTLEENAKVGKESAERVRVLESAEQALAKISEVIKKEEKALGGYCPTADYSPQF